MGSTEVGRRDLFKRAAALGLFAVPGVAALSACASGGGDGGDVIKRGPTSKENPFGVTKGNPLDVVVFKGGFGDEYAKQWESAFAEKYDAKISHLGTQEIRGKLQPRFNRGTPPDVIDNSGAQSIKLDVLHKQDQLTDLTELLDAPSVDDPNKKVRDTLIPGTAEKGFFGGKMHALNYVYTIWGLWYSGKLFKDNGWTPPKTWDDFIALMTEAKKKGIAGFAHQGKHPYYMNVVIMDLIAKTGGLDAMRAIDNLDPKAFVGNDAAKRSIEAVYEIVDKGLLLPGTNGLDHVESQTAWNENKALFVPSGSWLENEQLKSTPADFDMAFLPVPVLDDSAMPFHALRAGAGEPFIVPAKAKNQPGGLEFLRQMLSKEWSTSFAKEVSSLSIVEGAVDPGVKLRPGIKSAVAAVDACPVEDRFDYLYTEWYSEMDESIRGATSELMAKRIKPAEWLKKAQAAVDKAAKDPASKNNKRD
ncbi:N-acetylglucosamine/diacetylchitobiose ABC transporter substrate-binding protein [Streptomyces alkaliterrae]|uniref:Carbohydrate ABC transporter, N-acetylglucosamine/diacetylchitobiose-binding protein n=1 Tax=Streptomyces alkaliterrae TaxID=2213162 RepID=A0A5P0YLV4_9ACTN|nr:N-acetylglucosamine/diacetylchitobiose ABC transporter substrate-binding protein [Streptomyces alkaliterrae]MBB1262267.1 carbohydrate ABC transporter, N-acetylglucosamine/diacetylchitobiose-binding protein [Streptomyces alkaliterrae]MQS01344.1 carbohydrate ABC transporter, N-acetylglucosamine/diacetylchitobiose-binding protein [Streptomyces alkaliterrae]